MGRAAFALVCAASTASAASTEPIQQQQQAIIYDADSRTEVFEFPDPGARALASRTAALGRRSELRVDVSGAVSVVAPSWAERAALCPGLRFGDQPAFGVCTGVFLEPDLVLTAAHCLLAEDTPSELVLLDGFHYTAARELSWLTRENLHDILEVVARDDFYDYAWLRVSNPKADPLEWSVLDGPLPFGMRVLSINYGGGIPAKIDRGGRAFPFDEDSFLTSLDAFGGASGGPVLSESGDFLGILTSGRADYELSPDGCATFVQTSGSPETASELVLHARRALSGLCAADAESSVCAAPSSSQGETEAGCAMQRASAGRPRQDGIAVLGLALAATACLRMHYALRRRRPRNSPAAIASSQRP